MSSLCGTSHTVRQPAGLDQKENPSSVTSYLAQELVADNLGTGGMGRGGRSDSLTQMHDGDSII